MNNYDFEEFLVNYSQQRPDAQQFMRIEAIPAMS